MADIVSNSGSPTIGDMSSTTYDINASSSKSSFVKNLSSGFGFVSKMSQKFDHILKTVKDINKETAKLKSGGTGGTGNLFSGSDINAQTDAMMAKLNQMMPASGMSTGARVGFGIGKAALSVAALGYGMLPNVQDAVSQRIAAQSMASLTGGNPQDIIKSSNALLSGGMTGSYSAQLASSTLGGLGILAGTTGYNNIMKQTGGLSVLTGMSNEQVAGAFGSINGMDLLRVGIHARDNQGRMRSPGDIANDLYKRLIPGGRKLTTEQAANTFLAPHSSGQAAIRQIAGGDQALATALTEQLYFQAKGGGAKLNLNPENVKNKILGLEKDDPLRKMFTYNERQAKLLEKVGGAEVSGYGTALDASGKAAEMMSKLADVLPGVVEGMGKLKGFLDTFPMAGNTGASLTGAASSIGGAVSQYGGLYMQSQILKNIVGGKGGVPGGGGGGGIGGALGRFGKFGLGAAAIAATHWAVPKLRDFGKKHLGIRAGTAPDKVGTTLGYMGGYAAGGALIGSAVPVIGTAAGAVIGTIAGLGMGLWKSGVFGGGDKKEDPNTGGDSYTRTTWAQTLLKQLSITPNAVNTGAVVNWEAHEGGHWNNPDKYNPLNSTQPMPGSHGTNSANVQSYTSWDEGLKATVRTFQYQGKGYENILSALRSGTKDDIYQAVVDSGWGTKSLGGHTKSNKPKNVAPQPIVNGVYAPPTDAHARITAKFHQYPKVKGSQWNWRGWHTGIDYGVKEGTSVKAYKKGKVEAVGDGGSIPGVGSDYGKVVLINHGDHRSLYAHLSKPEVKAGQHVRPGQQIALSGNTGHSTGAHLHFEIRSLKSDSKGPIPLDPTPFLKGGSQGSTPPASDPSSGDTSSSNPTPGGGGGGGADNTQTSSLKSGNPLNPNTPTDAGLNSISVSNTGITSSTGLLSSMVGRPGNALGVSINTEGYSDGTGGDGGGLPGSLVQTPNTMISPASKINNSGATGITINMNINIANATTADAVNLAQQVKTILEKELRNTSVRTY